MSTKIPFHRTTVILILGALSALGPFSIDMYLSAFPNIAENFQVSENEVSYTLSSYFIGICIGQMFWGPILDRFGRKTPLILGLLVYVLASLGCSLAHTLEQLVVLRFVQAIGACIGLVAPRAIIRDAFPVKEIAKVFSLMMLILSVSPLLAPTVGSYVVKYAHWQSIFYILTGICLLITVMVLLYMPETKGPDESISLKPRPIVQGFIKVFNNNEFLIYTFAGSISAAGLYAYIAGSPVVFMDIYKVSKTQYGWIFATVAACLISCSQLNNVLLKKYSNPQIIRVCFRIQALAGIALLLGSYTDVLGLYGTIAFIAVYLGCQGFIYPNTSALSLAPFSKDAGIASALMGAIQMGLGALTATIIASFKAHNTVPLAMVMASCAFIGWMIILFSHKKRLSLA